MAKFNVVDMNGQHVSEIELSDAVFGITPNEKAVHIAVVNFLANQRQGTQNTKIRMEVSGGGKKPWRWLARKFTTAMWTAFSFGVIPNTASESSISLTC